MLTTKDRLVHEYKKLIREEYIRIQENLASGSALDYSQYRQQVGRIQGLAEALELLEAALRISDGNERGI